MTFSNWIELGIIITILAIGIIIKIKTRKTVNDIDGFSGIIKKKNIKGNIVANNGEKDFID